MLNLYLRHKCPDVTWLDSGGPSFSPTDTKLPSLEHRLLDLLSELLRPKIELYSQITYSFADKRVSDFKLTDEIRLV